MQTIFKFSLVSAMLLALFFTSCNDQGELGDSIIDASKIGVFTDEWSFSAVTRSTDSIEAVGSVRSFLVGKLQEDVFGTYNASFYTQFSLDNFDDTYDGVEVDSVFLELTYDTLATYGVEGEDFDIYVYRLEQAPVEAVDDFSNTTLGVSASPIGLIENFIPEIVVEKEVDTITTRQAGLLRIPLDLSLGEELLSYDSISYSSATDFRDQFKGIYVVGSDENKNMLGFRLSEFYKTTRLVVYYRDVDLMDTSEFTLRVAGSDFSLHKLDKDQSGAEISNYIDDQEASKDNLFLSGLAGNYIELDMEEAAMQLSDKLLNDAEVCFTLNEEEFSYDYETYPSVINVSSRFYNESGDLVPLVDQGLSTLQLDSTESVMQFCVNITGQLQSIVRKDFDSKILLRPLFRENNPKRAILYGVDNPDYPAKLNVYYTKPE